MGVEQEILARVATPTNGRSPKVHYFCTDLDYEKGESKLKIVTITIGSSALVSDCLTFRVLLTEATEASFSKPSSFHNGQVSSNLNIMREIWLYDFHKNSSKRNLLILKLRGKLVKMLKTNRLLILEWRLRTGIEGSKNSSNGHLFRLILMTWLQATAFAALTSDHSFASPIRFVGYVNLIRGRQARTRSFRLN